MSRSFVKIFCLAVTISFVGEPFSVSLFFLVGNFNAEEGFVTIFCQKRFIFKYGIISKKTLLCFTKFLISKNHLDEGEKGVSSTSFCEKDFFSHSAEKIVEEPFCVSENSDLEKF